MRDRRPYEKAHLRKKGNLKRITYAEPAWQVSCETPNHGPNGNGHGYGHVLGRGRGHHK